MPHSICLHCFKPKGGYEVCPHCGWVEGTLPDQAYHLRSGVVLADRYIIGTVIGYGGFGAIYKSWDSQLGLAVAVKEFYPSGLVSRVPGDKQVVVFSGEKKNSYHAALERFLTEARNMAQFNMHPNIVNVLNFFEENNTAYIIMEYLEGLSLSGYLSRRGGRLPPGEAVEIILPVAEALTAIHAAGIIHRDIHPGNIFITASNQVKLLDFGAAKFSTGESEKTLTVVVTQGYASPEQYRSKSRQGPFTDIYGAGAALYRMITGQVPEESIDRLLEDRLRKPSETGVALDRNLDRAVMTAMAIRPNLRFQTAAQLRDALTNKNSVDFPEETAKKRRRRRILAVASAAVVLIAAVIAVSLSYSVFKPEETLFNTVITDDVITLWAPSDSLSVYEDVARRFEGDNSQLTVSVVAVPEDEYAGRLADTIQTGDAPTLFLADYLPGGDGGAPLDLLVNSLDTDNYLFLSGYDSLYPSKRGMPMGFTLTVLYGNQNAAVADGRSVPDAVTDWRQLAELGSYSVGREGFGAFMALHMGVSAHSGTVSIPDDLADDLIRLKQTARAGSFEDPLALIAKDDLTFLAGNTSMMHSVQNALAGYCALIPLRAEDRMIVSFTDTWAVSGAATANQRHAAMLFLSFLLDTYAQDRIYLQGDTAIPIKREVFADYMQSNPDLSFLSGQMDRMILIGEDGPALSRFGADVYDNIILKNVSEDDIRAWLESYGNTR